MWNDTNTTMDNRWSLSALFKILDKYRLSKNAPAYIEDEQLAQLSCNMQHLLLLDGVKSENNNEKNQISSFYDMETEWRSANQNFLKCISSVRQLRQICCNFHQDFTLERVTRSLSYLDHLIAIQQEQCSAAYDFATSLEILKKNILALENLFTQNAVFITEEYESALRSGNHQEHMDEDSDRFVSGFIQALEQTYKGIVDSFSKFGSSNSHSVTENSVENICLWIAVFESNISRLKLEEIGRYCEQER